MKDIDKEIEELLALKQEVIKAKEFKTSYPDAIIVSQARYNFWAENNLLKQNVNYYIAPVEIKSYIEDFQG